MDVVGEGLRCLRPRDLGHAGGVQDVERERHVEAVDRPVVGRRPGERVHPRRLAGPGPRAAESDRTSLEHGRGEAAAEDLPGLGAVGGPPGGDARLVETEPAQPPVDRPVVDGACPGGGEVVGLTSGEPEQQARRRRGRGRSRRRGRPAPGCRRSTGRSGPPAVGRAGERLLGRLLRLHEAVGVDGGERLEVGSAPTWSATARVRAWAVASSSGGGTAPLMQIAPRKRPQASGR